MFSIGKLFTLEKLLSLFRRDQKTGLILPLEHQPDNLRAAMERMMWNPQWQRDIYHNCNSFAEALARGLKPDDSLLVPGNLLLNAGITGLQKLLIGSSFNAYNAANAQIAVGNGNTAESASQTDLQGASKARAGMEATFPSVASQTATWKSSYGSSAANFNWLEVGVQNGSGTPDGTTVVLLNRKQQDLGTKVSGSTWTMTLSITIS